MRFDPDDEKESAPERYQTPENAPIEPESSHLKRFGFKIFFFLIFSAYLIFNFFKVPILTQLGEYLVVQDRLEKADLIVCLAGNNVERGLATIDLYRQDWAPFIFLAREELVDGYETLKDRRLHYPETRDLLAALFKEADLPESAVIQAPGIAASTYDEAGLVRAWVKQKGLRSLIIVTSPTHCRRALLTFKKVLKDQNVKIMIIPSSYSRFNPQSWWKEHKYVREVVLEYEKLICYSVKYFL
jgi:uncharacterized SAM-binding protein YcdF (DUF218 family)